MALLIMRVLLAPVLLAICAFVASRWGATAGGWLLGLPLISGPVSIMLMLERGTGFAESAARGTLLGLLATGAFCASYALMSRRSPWWLSLTLSYAVCLAAAGGLSRVSLPIVGASGLVLGALAVFGASLGPSEPCDPAPKPRPGALLIRMVIAGTIVASVTAGAGLLGAQASGLLAPLPLLLALAVAGAHRRQGGDAARGLLRGALAGSLGGVAFFATVGLLLGIASPVLAYGAALAAAIAAGAAAFGLQRSAIASRLLNRHAFAFMLHG